MQQTIRIEEPNKIPAIFQLGFRVFFLSGTLFCVLALFLWGTQFFHGNTIAPFGGSYWWHSHEMVFGFSFAIIAGFLLTAVQTWTGVPSIKGIKLAALFAIWLTARLLLLFPGSIPVMFISLLDLSFIPLVAFALAYPIIKIRQWKNLIFMPIMLLLFISNLLMHRGVWLEQLNLTQNAVWAAILTVVMLISIMGGRVIPFFTANATATKKPEPFVWLDLLANIPILFLIIFYIAGKPNQISSENLFAITAFGALFQAIRMLRWKFWLCFKNPLLWSLHTSYIFIPLGLILLSLHYAGFAITVSQALHSFTVGGIGGLILAMIARVSLGHTGRKLETLSGMGFAFFLMLLAGLIRSPASALQLMSPLISLTVSFACFILAYCIFLWHYIPILFKKRIDGRPG